MEALLLKDAKAGLVTNISSLRSEPEWLLNQRLEALKLFQKLPQEKSPLYAKYSDLKEVDFKGVDLSSVGSTSPQEAKIPQELQFTVKDVEVKSSLFQVDNKVVNIVLDEEYRKKGVVLTDIATALQEMPDLVRSYFSAKGISPEEDKFVALNHAFFNSGIFLYVPKYVVIEEPIQTLFLSNTSGVSVFNRNLIVVEEGSSIKFVEEAYSTDSAKADGHSIYSATTELHLGQGAEIAFGGIQNLGENVINLVNRRSIGGGNSRITWSIGYFGGGLTRARLDNVMAEPNASTEDMEIVFADNAQRFDIVSDLTHRSPSTKGTVLVRGVLRNKAQAIFKGMIKIDKGAKNSEAYLAEHAMLLGRGARANAVPGLEIETNEVKATHSASVALIDDEDIFYLMSRGLSEDEAHRMAVLAFLEPAVRRIPSSNIRFRIWYLLERKWLGDKGAQLKPEDMIEPVEEVKEVGRSGPQEFFESHYKYSGD